MVFTIPQALFTVFQGVTPHAIFTHHINYTSALRKNNSSAMAKEDKLTTALNGDS